MDDDVLATSGSGCTDGHGIVAAATVDAQGVVAPNAAVFEQHGGVCAA